jgi:hypothetical protein
MKPQLAVFEIATERPMRIIAICTILAAFTAIAATGRCSPPVQIKPSFQGATGSEPTPMDFRLLPEAVIRGKVVMSDGNSAGAWLVVTAVPASINFAKQEAAFFIKSTYVRPGRDLALRRQGG